MAQISRGAYAIIHKMLGEQIARHDAIMKPHQEAVAVLVEQQTQLAMAAGFNQTEPTAWCEFCGAPFFDFDTFQRDADGVSTCRRDYETEQPCFQPDMKQAMRAFDIDDDEISTSYRLTEKGEEIAKRLRGLPTGDR